MTKKFTKAIQGTCDKSFSIIKKSDRKRKCPWWNEELDELKKLLKRVNKAKHSLQRARSRSSASTSTSIHSSSEQVQQQEATYDELKSLYATAIKQHSASNFNNFIGQLADQSHISIINEIINHHRMTICSTTTMTINNITTTNIMDTINGQLNYFFW